MKGKTHTPEQIIGKLREADAELNAGPPYPCETPSVAAGRLWN